MSEPASTIDSLYPEEIYQLQPKVLVVLSRKWSSLTEQEIILLSKILGSVKLSLASVQIVTHSALSDRKLVDAYSPEKIVAFGLDISNLKKYEHQSFEGIPIVIAEDFRHLDDTKKRTLWLALKAMFGL
ncbi:MAG: hypothetical protein JNM57_05215 [Cyclobacteriaceae bacterium]|nr:hypothetical protein [Cyclobacteriaceae bacterium]